MLAYDRLTEAKLLPHSGHVESLGQKVQAAFAAVQSGALVKARTILASVPPAQHDGENFHLVSAILERRSGNLGAAETHFRRALALFPENPAIRNGLANLLDDMADPHGAIAQYQAALVMAPHYIEARYNLGLVHNKLGDVRAARDSFAVVVRQAPDHGAAWLALGLAHRALGETTQAGRAIDAALRLDPGSAPALHARAAIKLDQVEALGEAGEIKLARDSAERLVDAQPHWPEAQRALAKLRWQAGDQEGFAAGYDRALATSQDPALWQSYFTTLAQAGDYRRLLDRIDAARAACGAPDGFTEYEAISASESGDEALADRLFARIDSGDQPDLLVARGRHLLRKCAGDEAAGVLERAAQVGAASAWPYLSLAWRLTGDPRASWLDNCDLVSTYDDPGFEALLPALTELLRPMHGANRSQLDQTVRGGSQTLGNLLAREDPVLLAFRNFAERSVARYIDSLPSPDPAHPFLSVPRGGFRLQGSWSVRLTGGGLHTSHVHPQGWISSAFYVTVPELGLGDDGHLAFGEGPAELGLDLPALKVIAPRPGRLVLFPSHMWHGTRPSPPGERMSIAFDVVPAAS